MVLIILLMVMLHLVSTMSGNVKGGAITPSEGVTKCNLDGAANTVTYFMK